MGKSDGGNSDDGEALLPGADSGDENDMDDMPGELGLRAPWPALWPSRDPCCGKSWGFPLWVAIIACVVFANFVSGIVNWYTTSSDLPADPTTWTKKQAEQWKVGFGSGMGSVAGSSSTVAIWTAALIMSRHPICPGQCRPLARRGESCCTGNLAMWITGVLACVFKLVAGILLSCLVSWETFLPKNKTQVVGRVFIAEKIFWQLGFWFLWSYQLTHSITLTVDTKTIAESKTAAAGSATIKALWALIGLGFTLNVLTVVFVGGNDQGDWEQMLDHPGPPPWKMTVSLCAQTLYTVAVVAVTACLQLK